MTLGSAVKGARHTPQTITWQDEDGNAWDLSNGTLTGTMVNIKDDSTARDIDGDFAFTGSGSDGEFTWTYGALDVGTVGEFWVQLKNTHSDDSYDMTKKTLFEVFEVTTVAA